MATLVTKLKQWLWGRVLLRTDRDYRFSLSADGALTCSEAGEVAGSPFLVLMGRAHCYELRSPLPSVDSAEAAKIAKNMPVASPFGANLRRNRLALQGDNNVAHITLIRRASVAEWLQAPFLLIPTTWLFDELVDGQPAVVELPGEIVGLAPSKSGYQTRLLDGSPAAESDFWWSAGHQAEEIRRLEAQTVLANLGASLKKLALRDWVEALWRPEVSPLDRIKALDWRNGAKLAVGGFSLYMVLSSVLLISANWLFDRQLSREPQAFTDALTLRAETNRLKATDKAWQDTVGDQYATWAVWPPIMAVWTGDVAVTGVNLVDGQAEAFMSANSATDVLTAFKQSPFVQNADFGVSVRRSRSSNRDTFSIVWSPVDAEPSEPSIEAGEADSES